MNGILLLQNRIERKIILLRNTDAFTLAEVLITLAIIGVVAAMTIPTLINGISDARYKSAWKKNYSVISQAYISLINDNSGTTDTNALLNQLFNGDYLASVRKCAFPTINICGSTTAGDGVYHTLSGAVFSYPNMYDYQWILTDGTTVYSRAEGAATEFNIFFDVNGYQKGPNVLGKDLFGIIATPTTLLPMGAPSSEAGLVNTCNTTAAPCSGNAFHGGDCAGAGCSAELLYK